MENASTCPSTLWDLLFWCLLFFVPCTSAFSFFVWQRRCLGDLMHRYSQNGMTVTAKILHKQAKTVREYRGCPDDYILQPVDTLPDFEEYEIRPFCLTVEYSLDDGRHFVSKRLEVPKSRYQHSRCGDSMQLSYLPGQDTSAVLLEDLRTMSNLSNSGTVFCAFLTFGVFGVCAITGWCLPFGWWIIFATFVVTFVSTLFILGNVTIFRKNLEATIVRGETGSLLVDTTSNQADSKLLEMI